MALLPPIAGNLSVQRPAEAIPIDLQVVRMGDVLKGLRRQFLLRAADDPAKRWIDLNQRPSGKVSPIPIAA